MTLSGFLILTAGLLLAAPGAGQEERPEDDAGKLQRTWLTVALVNDGKVLVGENVPPKGPATKLAYEGNRWLIQVGDKTIASGIFKVDATKVPKEIDILDESGMKNGQTKLGIYELDGDTYRYCLAPAGKPRPPAFSSPEGNGYSLGVSRREKI